MLIGTRTFPADVEKLDELMSWVEDMMRISDLESGVCSNILLASEEIFVNIANYAYPSGEGSVTISFTQADAGFEIEFEDCGIHHDPLARSDPDIDAKVEDRPIGGLGIFLVKKLMDNVSYRYEGGKNILTISKKAT